MVRTDPPVPARLRGVRPFFWTTAAADVAANQPASANALRDLLGLSHIRGGFLLELRYSRGQVGDLHRPTVLDAFDNPSFYPVNDPSGWGVTDDIGQTTRTPGVREAVTLERELEAAVWTHGDLDAAVPPVRG